MATLFPSEAQVLQATAEFSVPQLQMQMSCFAYHFHTHYQINAQVSKSGRVNTNKATEVQHASWKLPTPWMRNGSGKEGRLVLSTS